MYLIDILYVIFDFLYVICDISYTTFYVLCTVTWTSAVIPFIFFSSAVRILPVGTHSAMVLSVFLVWLWYLSFILSKVLFSIAQRSWTKQAGNVRSESQKKDEENNRKKELSKTEYLNLAKGAFVQ